MAQSAVQYKEVLVDEAASIAFAAKLAKAFEGIFLHNEDSGLIVYLYGDLGAGKSFLSRALIQYYAPSQKVKSPTYTLVESYPIDFNGQDLQVHHFDLYRLCDPEELEYLAFRELFQGPFLALVEWPQKGRPVLPPADLEITLSHLELGREILLTAKTDSGSSVIKTLL